MASGSTTRVPALQFYTYDQLSILDKILGLNYSWYRYQTAFVGGEKKVCSEKPDFIKNLQARIQEVLSQVPVQESPASGSAVEVPAASAPAHGGAGQPSPELAAILEADIPTKGAALARPAPEGSAEASSGTGVVVPVVRENKDLPSTLSVQEVQGIFNHKDNTCLPSKKREYSPTKDDFYDFIEKFLKNPYHFLCLNEGTLAVFSYVLSLKKSDKEYEGALARLRNIYVSYTEGRFLEHFLENSSLAFCRLYFEALPTVCGEFIHAAINVGMLETSLKEFLGFFPEPTRRDAYNARIDGLTPLERIFGKIIKGGWGGKKDVAQEYKNNLIMIWAFLLEVGADPRSFSYEGQPLFYCLWQQGFTELSDINGWGWDPRNIARCYIPQLVEGLLKAYLKYFQCEGIIFSSIFSLMKTDFKSNNYYEPPPLGQYDKMYLSSDTLKCIARYAIEHNQLVLLKQVLATPPQRNTIFFYDPYPVAVRCYRSASETHPANDILKSLLSDPFFVRFKSWGVGSGIKGGVVEAVAGNNKDALRLILSSEGKTHDYSILRKDCQASKGFGPCHQAVLSLKGQELIDMLNFLKDQKFDFNTLSFEHKEGSKLSLHYAIDVIIQRHGEASSYLALAWLLSQEKAVVDREQISLAHGTVEDYAAGCLKGARLSIQRKVTDIFAMTPEKLRAFMDETLGVRPVEGVAVVPTAPPVEVLETENPPLAVASAPLLGAVPEEGGGTARDILNPEQGEEVGVLATSDPEAAGAVPERRERSVSGQQASSLSTVSTEESQSRTVVGSENAVPVIALNPEEAVRNALECLQAYVQTLRERFDAAQASMARVEAITSLSSGAAPVPRGTTSLAPEAFESAALSLGAIQGVLEGLRTRTHAQETEAQRLRSEISLSQVARAESFLQQFRAGQEAVSQHTTEMLP